MSLGCGHQTKEKQCPETSASQHKHNCLGDATTPGTRMQNRQQSQKNCPRSVEWSHKTVLLLSLWFYFHKTLQILFLHILGVRKRYPRRGGRSRKWIARIEKTKTVCVGFSTIHIFRQPQGVLEVSPQVRRPPVLLNHNLTCGSLHLF